MPCYMPTEAGTRKSPCSYLNAVFIYKSSTVQSTATSAVPASLPIKHMDHHQFLSGLSATQRKAIQKKTDIHGLVQMAVHVGLLVLFATLIHIRVTAWPLLILPQGIMLVFLFNLQHECTHKTPFKSVWINELVGFVCGAIIIQPFLWFRYFHLVHHRYTNDPERDPEIMGHKKPETWREYLLFASTLNYWQSKLALLYRHLFFAINDAYVPTRARRAVKIEALLLSLLYLFLSITMVFYSSALFWVWLLPLMVGFPFLKLYHLAEHGMCPMVENKFVNTRTVVTNRLTKLITWNMPYHTEHHLLPSVPFHQLPTLHKKVKTHLQITSEGYAAFSGEYLQNLHVAAPKA